MTIRFGTYKICNGRNGGLESVLRVMSQANMDLGIFQEKKLTKGVYTCSSDRYSGVATDAPIQHCGGVAVFYRLSPHYGVEAIQKSGPTVVVLHLTTREQRWYISGCYLAPENTSTLESVIAELKERPRGTTLLVAGDLNIKLADPEGYWREEDIGVGGSLRLVYVPEPRVIFKNNR